MTVTATWAYIPWVCPSLHRNQGGLKASDTVGLVVEYAPATGETRVRFPDGVASLQTIRPLFNVTSTIFAQAVNGSINPKSMHIKILNNADMSSAHINVD